MAKKKDPDEAKKSPRKALKKPERPAKKLAKPAKKLPSAQISFICSECYEEFYISAEQMKETVTCPECLHVGKRPAEDFLKTVQLHKSGELQSLVLASSTAGLLVLSIAGWIWVKSPYQNLQNPDLTETLTLVSGGAVLLFFIAILWFIIRYEKNRWEVYF